MCCRAVTRLARIPPRTSQERRLLEEQRVAAEAAFNDLLGSCAICMSEFDQPLQTKCRHLFCGPCIRSYLATRAGRADCPLCRSLVIEAELVLPPARPPPPQPPPPSSAAAGDQRAAMSQLMDTILGDHVAMRSKTKGRCQCPEEDAVF